MHPFFSKCRLRRSFEICLCSFFNLYWGSTYCSPSITKPIPPTRALRFSLSLPSAIASAILVSWTFSMNNCPSYSCSKTIKGWLLLELTEILSFNRLHLLEESILLLQFRFVSSQQYYHADFSIYGKFSSATHISDGYPLEFRPGCLLSPRVSCFYIGMAAQWSGSSGPFGRIRHWATKGNRLFAIRIGQLVRDKWLPNEYFVTLSF